MFTNYSTVIDSSGASILAPSKLRIPRLFDWNIDSKLDLLVGANGYIWLHLNIGTSSAPIFTSNAAKINSSSGFAIKCRDNLGPSFTLIDWNGDGVKDLILTDSQSKLVVYINTAAATSTPNFSDGFFVTSYLTRTAIILLDRNIDAADWNGDGFLDIITGGYANNIYLYLSSASRQLGNATILLTNQSNFFYPRLFDIDYDGILDLIAGFDNGSISYWLDPFYRGLSNSNSIIVEMNSNKINMGNETYGPIVEFGDLNGDCNLDIVVGGHSSSYHIFVAFSASSSPRTCSPSPMPSLMQPITTISPTAIATNILTISPTTTNTVIPTSLVPTVAPTITNNPSPTPSTIIPTVRPTFTYSPTIYPTTTVPTIFPSFRPTVSPSTAMPSTITPTVGPTFTYSPTISPSTTVPTIFPSFCPTVSPSTAMPTSTSAPSISPTTVTPTFTKSPTVFPSISPSYQTTLIQYNYSGSVQSFTMPNNLPVYSIYVKVIGGGGGYSDGAAGGPGGSVQAQIAVSPGAVLLITVGKADHPYKFH